MSPLEDEIVWTRDDFEQFDRALTQHFHLPHWWTEEAKYGEVYDLAQETFANIPYSWHFKFEDMSPAYLGKHVPLYLWAPFRTMIDRRWQEICAEDTPEQEEAERVLRYAKGILWDY